MRVCGKKAFFIQTFPCTAGAKVVLNQAFFSLDAMMQRELKSDVIQLLSGCMVTGQGIGGSILTTGKFRKFAVSTVLFKCLLTCLSGLAGNKESFKINFTELLSLSAFLIAIYS